MMKSKEFSLDVEGKVNIRLYNHPDSMIALRSLKAAYIGMYILFPSYRNLIMVATKLSVVMTFVDRQASVSAWYCCQGQYCSATCGANGFLMCKVPNYNHQDVS